MERRRRGPRQRPTGRADPDHPPRSRMAPRLSRRKWKRLHTGPLDPSMKSRDPRAIPARRATRTRTVVWIAILLAVRFSLLVLTEVGTQSKGILEEGSKSTILADASRYQRIVRSPGIPYKNFEVEYPPVGLGAIEAVGRGSIASTRTILGLVGFALDGVTVLVLLSGWGEGVAIAYLVLGTSLALFAYYRIDFLAVALSVLAIDLMRRGKDRS